MSMATIGILGKTSQTPSHNVTIATDGIRIPRATSGPALELDLITLAEQLRQEAAWSDGRNSRTLVKHGDFRMVLTVMKAGARLHKHNTRGTALIQVLSGRVRARVLDGLMEMPKGHALSLDPYMEHEIEAVEESALLITIAWPKDFSIVRKDPAVELCIRRLDALDSVAVPAE